MTVRVFDQPSQANPVVALVRDAWMAIGQGDYDRLEKLLTDDVLWPIPKMPNVLFAGDWHGPDGVRRSFKTVEAVQESIVFSPFDLVVEDDKVVVVGRFGNRVKATGRLSESKWAQVWTVRDDHIASMVEFVDTNAVNRAFGA